MLETPLGILYINLYHLLAKNVCLIYRISFFHFMKLFFCFFFTCKENPQKIDEFEGNLLFPNFKGPFNRQQRQKRHPPICIFNREGNSDSTGIFRNILRNKTKVDKKLRSTSRRVFEIQNFIFFAIDGELQVNLQI